MGFRMSWLHLSAIFLAFLLCVLPHLCVSEPVNSCHPFLRSSTQRYDREFAFFYEAELQARRDDLTLLVGATTDQLSYVSQLAESWEGPMSVAVYIINSTTDLPELLSARSRSVALRRFTDLHVHFPMRLGDLPVNRLLNLAWKYARTDLVFPVEPQFWASPGLREKLLRIRSTLTNADKTVWLLPSFDLARDFTGHFPRTKMELKRMWVKRNVTLMTPLYEPSHGPVDYTRWLTTKDTYKIDYRVRMEPYGIFKRQAPIFDERYRARGCTRSIHTWELDLAGYEFRVLNTDQVPDGFLIHVGEEKYRPEVLTPSRTYCDLNDNFFEDARKKKLLQGYEKETVVPCPDTVDVEVLKDIVPPDSELYVKMTDPSLVETRDKLRQQMYAMLPQVMHSSSDAINAGGHGMEGDLNLDFVEDEVKLLKGVKFYIEELREENNKLSVENSDLLALRKYVDELHTLENCSVIAMLNKEGIDTKLKQHVRDAKNELLAALDDVEVCRRDMNQCALRLRNTETELVDNVGENTRLRKELHRFFHKMKEVEEYHEVVVQNGKGSEKYYLLDKQKQRVEQYNDALELNNTRLEKDLYEARLNGKRLQWDLDHEKSVKTFLKEKLGDVQREGLCDNDKELRRKLTDQVESSKIVKSRIETCMKDLQLREEYIKDLNKAKDTLDRDNDELGKQLKQATISQKKEDNRFEQIMDMNRRLEEENRALNDEVGTLRETLLEKSNSLDVISKQNEDLDSENRYLDDQLKIVGRQHDDVDSLQQRLKNLLATDEDRSRDMMSMKIELTHEIATSNMLSQELAKIRSRLYTLVFFLGLASAAGSFVAIYIYYQRYYSARELKKP